MSTCVCEHMCVHACKETNITIIFEVLMFTLLLILWYGTVRYAMAL